MNFKKNIDNFGVFLSSLCAVHCALIPIVIFLFPAASLFFKNNEDLTHIFIFIFTLPAVFFALYSAIKIHGEKTPLYFILPGLFIVFLGTFFVHTLFGHFWEPVIVIIGSLLMLKGHLLNKHHCEHCHQCTHE